MPLMWELPQAAAGSKGEPLLHLRHSITNTDYKVLVFAEKESALNWAKWVSIRKAAKLPLTGLARKILNRIGAQ
jgi:A/G-specific adenine glycosylase